MGSEAQRAPLHSNTCIAITCDWNFSLKRMFATTILTLLSLMVHPVFSSSPNSGACRNDREEFGFALVGHDYRSVHADHFGRCFFLCSSEQKCQSITYLWDKKECKMNNETKRSRPEDFLENPAATYMENNIRAKKGSIASVPGYSCHDILTSGDARGDGEYWIDPTASGDPFRVFCDMTTDQGGWTLIGRFIMENQNSNKDPVNKSDSYREILPKYNVNNQLLLRDGFNQLKSDMGFTQIRFYCYKKNPGRVFHIMTRNNSKGANVVKFFTETDGLPGACGSFTRLGDDNAVLSKSCQEWGQSTGNRWGHKDYLRNSRLFQRPMMKPFWRYYQFSGSLPYSCDDKLSDKAMSLGDIWRIFVR